MQEARIAKGKKGKSDQEGEPTWLGYVKKSHRGEGSPAPGLEIQSRERGIPVIPVTGRV